MSPDASAALDAAVDPPTHADPSVGRAEWIKVLDDMEADLAKAESLIQSDIAPDAAPAWSPPTHLDPIPGDLRERVGQLLVAQRDAAERLHELRNATGAQLAAVRSIPSVQSREHAIYLDVTG